MENCLFCKIIAGEIPATKMYEDENMIIIKDIDPTAFVFATRVSEVMGEWNSFSNVTNNSK